MSSNPYVTTLLQGSHIKIKTNTEIPVQVDGEPWLQPPGDIVVLRSALKVNYSIFPYFKQGIFATCGLDSITDTGTPKEPGFFKS